MYPPTDNERGGYVFCMLLIDVLIRSRQTACRLLVVSLLHPLFYTEEKGGYACNPPVVVNPPKKTQINFFVNKHHSKPVLEVKL